MTGLGLLGAMRAGEGPYPLADRALFSVLEPGIDLPGSPVPDLVGAGLRILLGIGPVLLSARVPGDRPRAPAVTAPLAPLWGLPVWAGWHGMHPTRDVL